MRLTVIGTGYVGLVTGACLADTGNEVVGVDKDSDKAAALDRGECPIYEPGLAELLQANMKASRLRFTTDIAQGVRHGDVIFIAVGTPPRDDGSSDMTAVRAVADTNADQIDRP